MGASSGSNVQLIEHKKSGAPLTGSTGVSKLYRLIE
jgi:hypothetical protein